MTGTFHMVDVSHFQDGDGPRHPLVDWEEVVADPRVRGIMVKADQTGQDPEFRYNWTTLRHLVPNPTGEPHSPLLFIYHFHTNEDPKLQAQRCYNVVGPLRRGEGVMVDFEPVPKEGIREGTPPEQAALLAEIERLFERIPLRYSGDSAPNPLTARWPRHIARYRNTPPDHICTVWQFGSTVIPGIYGPVDANQVNDWTTLYRSCGLIGSEDGDLTAEESKMLKEIWTAMKQGVPGFGVAPVDTQVSKNGYALARIEAKLGTKP